MAFSVALRRAHRVVAGLFLLSIPPAGFFSLSATGGEVSPVVYLPLFPLLGLTLTGGYLLARPWVRRLRANWMLRRQLEMKHNGRIVWLNKRNEVVTTAVRPDCRTATVK